MAYIVRREHHYCIDENGIVENCGPHEPETSTHAQINSLLFLPRSTYAKELRRLTILRRRERRAAKRK